MRNKHHAHLYISKQLMKTKMNVYFNVLLYELLCEKERKIAAFYILYSLNLHVKKE